jgi:hypothetical protein
MAIAIAEVAATGADLREEQALDTLARVVEEDGDLPRSTPRHVML